MLHLRSFLGFLSQYMTGGATLSYNQSQPNSSKFHSIEPL